ncbi:MULTISPECIES: nitrate/nitrite transporter [unclassified Rathayibacter]|uniref:MFS transporter n=1 Tax=unclassified Rathayibacter TaxID=2609250 RepID=UPI000CE7DA6D|nr:MULTISPECIES: MFS transporter [unclassified Rathayibacter]PPG83987.1 MFS transporter [Rathayibacter sp. AY1E5]PPH32660.1 MFS transporter [Rathayibacter sp. AY1C3]PPH57101.1 MFS transporter [Rathayibacter sp. AY1D7]PPI33728.1 MFS transporter [Rathayibacter sp. AY1B4]QHF20206.1 MFS transporter [Rathayibacter sp. VKM Ac-2762]
MRDRRAWFVFGAGAFAYLVAVLDRTTLGVAGVDAAERFGVAAAVLSSLAVVQLIVYAGMQIPVGILIDRFGPRTLILSGTALMMAGQVVVAIAPSIGVAIVGRILLGAGDAAIFTSVIRLTVTWFSGPIVPQLSQWIGNIGQVGQILSALPFAAILHTFGWEPAFLSAAGLGAVSFLGVLLLVADVPPRTEPITVVPPTLRATIAQLGVSLRRPGTQLGFWSHFVTQSSGTVFTLLWGYPFLVYAIGLPPTVAAPTLTIVVIAGIVVGPVLGVLTARHPMRRSNLVLGIVSAMAVAWTVVLLWPGVPPYWLVVLLLIVVGAGGPGSMIGFDFARTFNPSRSLGAANGVVNVGGFLASFTMMFAIGLILDALAGPGASSEQTYSLEHFRLAWCVQYVVVGAGVVGLVVARRRTRRRLAEDEGITVAPLWVALSDRMRRGRAGR